MQRSVIEGLRSDVFIVRQRELEGLETPLGDAISGRSRVVMLFGEPGIAKARTVQEFTNRAVAQGFRPTFTIFRMRSLIVV